MTVLEPATQVEVRLDTAIGRLLDADDVRLENGAGTLSRLRVVVLPRAQEALPRGPVRGRDAVDLDLQRIVVGAPDGKHGFLTRVEHDHLRARSVERAVRGPHVEPDVGRFPERLAERVAKVRRDVHRVVLPAVLRAVDDDRVAAHADRRVERGLDRHGRRIERLRIERVVRGDDPGHVGRAHAIPAALVRGDLERRVGVEPEALIRLGRARAFERTQPLLHGERVGRRLPEIGRRQERDEAVLLRRGLPTAAERIGFDLRIGREPKLEPIAAAFEARVREHLLRIDLLIERHRNHRMEGVGPVLRRELRHVHGRCAEREGHRLRQRSTRGGFRSRGDRHRVRGRSGKPAFRLARAPVRIELECLRTEPAPAARGLRLEPDRNVRACLRLCADRDHRLVECDHHVRHDGEVAVRSMARHVERTRRRWCGALAGGRRSGEGLDLRGARERRRFTRRPERERLAVAALLAERFRAREQSIDLAVGQRGSGRDTRALGRFARRRDQSEREAETFELLVLGELDGAIGGRGRARRRVRLRLLFVAARDQEQEGRKAKHRFSSERAPTVCRGGNLT